MLSAFSVERCPPSRWNTVRHQPGIVSAIAWNTQLAKNWPLLGHTLVSGLAWAGIAYLTFFVTIPGPAKEKPEADKPQQVAKKAAASSKPKKKARPAAPPPIPEEEREQMLAGSDPTYPMWGYGCVLAKNDQGKVRCDESRGTVLMNMRGEIVMRDVSMDAPMQFLDRLCPEKTKISRTGYAMGPLLPGKAMKAMLHTVRTHWKDAKGTVAPMATPNCSTYGRSNCSRQDGVDYDDSGLMAMRAAASLRR